MGAELEQFLVRNGIKHVISAPFYLHTNGEAERTSCSYKDVMCKQSIATDVNLSIASFLQMQYPMPHIATGAIS